jgi:flagellar basal body-associated protein FliL
MPDEAPSSPDIPIPPSEIAPGGATSWLTKAVVLLFLVVVVVGECLVAYMCIPSQSEAAAMVGVATDAPPPQKAPKTEPVAVETEATDQQVEVDLGTFSVTAYQPAANTTLRIDFHLFGTASASEAKDLQSHLEENTHRFRDQVIVTLRSSDITDLTDAGLGLIKRKILEKTNAMLGKRYLKTVIFSDFSFIEQ